MGRPLPSMQTLGFLAAAAAAAPVTSLLIIILTSAVVFSVVIFLCGSHVDTRMVKCLSLRGKEEKKTVRLGGDQKKKHRVAERMRSSLSSKALLMSKMISWRKVQNDDDDDDEEEEVDEDGVVWKKTIIKGEKCRPIDFSGKILYDSDGNLLPD